MKSAMYPVSAKDAEEFAQRLAGQSILQSVLEEDLIDLARVGILLDMPHGMAYSDFSEEIAGPVGVRRNALAFLVEGALDIWLYAENDEHIHFRYVDAPNFIMDFYWPIEGYFEEHSIIARSDTRLFVIGQEALGFLTDKYPRVALNMVHEYQEWIRWDLSRILASRSKNAEERIARFIREKALTSYTRTGNAAFIHFDTQVIADASCVPEHLVATTIKRFQDANFLRIDGDCMYVNLKKLGETIARSGKHAQHPQPAFSISEN